MSDQLPIVAKIQEEVAELKRELQVDLPKQLEEARAHGDLKENAEYHAAKDRQGMLNARIGQLQGRLSELSLFTMSSIPRDSIGYGSQVELEDIDSGEELSYELVFSEEANPENGRISINSPIGKALLRKKAGDEGLVQTPKGKRTFEVLSFTTIHERDLSDLA